MPVTVAITRTAILQGQQYNDDQTVSADNTITSYPSVPAAKTGTLTTRTDDNTGVLTMASGHGITTGALLDVYWTGGSRVGMTVGTVSGTSVPIDGGSGNVLPAATTAVTAAVPVGEAFVFEGDDLQVLALRANTSAATFHITESDGTTIHYTVRRSSLSSYTWNENDGNTNPVAGDSIGKILFSHAGSSAPETLYAGAAHS